MSYARALTCALLLLLVAATHAGADVSLAGGYEHTCAVTGDGALECWGANYKGQLGDGTTTGRLVPTPVFGLSSGVRTVTAGFEHSCALTTAGAVRCWGHNGYGQLGDGSGNDALSPAAVVGLSSGVQAISAGDFHTCAVTGSGGVKCWGDNTYGQLGDGTQTGRAVPVAVAGLAEVQSLASGEGHTCALTKAGSVKCWGANFQGELGDGTTTSRSTPVGVVGVTGEVTAIAAGPGGTCALLASGGVRCWGGEDLPARDIPGLSSVVAIVGAGFGPICALTSAGGVKCWGTNLDGEVGDGTRIDRATPTDVVGLKSGVWSLGAGRMHVCASTTDDAIRCWGSNSEGQLGNGVPPRILQPAAVSGLGSGMASASGAVVHTCGVSATGGVLCWGDNAGGQLGDGTMVDRSRPVEVGGLGSGIARVSAAAGFSCALTTGGGVLCWGTGLLGDGTTTSSTSPVGVQGLASGVASLAQGFGHSCVVTVAGGAKCWGVNRNGVLGDGTLMNRLSPIDVSGLTSGVAAIAAGVNHTCALTTAGGVKCWGIAGFVGDGTLEGRLTPVDVLGLASGVTAIAAGDSHTCALLSSGAVKCWGDGSRGQLGLGVAVSTLSPFDVVGLGTVTSIHAGGNHTCARTLGGGLKCWGANFDGEVGDGTRTDRLSPVDVLGLTSGVTSVDGGVRHTCAVANGGTYCWGNNKRGQLGIGILGYSAVPVRVSGFEGTCGNGTVDAGEACDDGGVSDGDCCTSTCQLANGASDRDADGICNAPDNCPRDYNPDQRDSDDEGRGDLCDLCPADDANACDVKKTTAETIGPGGEMIVVPDGSIELKVPPGAVPVDTSFSITGRTDSGFGLKITEKTPLVAEFEPSGATFNPPVKITLKWQDRNDNCFVDNPSTTCPIENHAGCGTRNPSCDLPVLEENLQIFRNGAPYPSPGTRCGSDSGCDREANAWTISVQHFSEYVLGEPTCTAIGRPNVEVRNLQTPPGDEKVTLKGNLTIDVPIEPALNPIANGLTVEIKTAQDEVVLSQQLPAGAYDAQTKEGWNKFPDRDTWTYRGKPPGVKTAKVSLLSAAEGKVKINVLARGLTAPALAAEDLPLKARVFVDGRCGDAGFLGPAPQPECALGPDASLVRCR